MNTLTINRKSINFYLMQTSMVFFLAINPFTSPYILAATSVVDSASFAPLQKKPNKIFIKETGSTSTITGTLTINSACPTSGFTPYVALSLDGLTAQTSSNYSNKAPINFKICVTSINTVSGAVNVNYNRSANFVTYVQYRWYHYDSGIWTYHISYSTTDDGYRDDYYVSNSDIWSFSLAVDEKLPRISYVSSSSSSLPSSLSKLTWTLYCYPIGMAVPTDSCT